MRTLFVSLVLCTAISLNAQYGIALQKDSTTVKLEGQVVCSKCYPMVNPTKDAYGSESDIQCAVRCAKSGIPAALAVRGESGTTLYILEKKKSNTEWANYLGQHLEVTATVREEGNRRYLKVFVIKLLSAEGR
jgi:hypothetical protein